MGKPEDIGLWRNQLLDWLEEDLKSQDRPDEAEDLFDEEDDDELPEGERPTELLSFRLGEETYGLDIRSVTEILRPRLITPLPRAPGFILGVVSLRGTILPVADIAARIGRQATGSKEKKFRIVVLRDGEETMGFLVDAVTGVVRFSPGEMEDTSYGKSIDPEFLVGIGYDAKKNLVAMLDARRLCEFSLEDYE